MARPTHWREALGHELTAAQLMAEYAKVRAATGQALTDWIRARAIDRATNEVTTWQTLDTQTLDRLAGQLGDEAALEVQRRQLRP